MFKGIKKAALLSICLFTLGCVLFFTSCSLIDNIFSGKKETELTSSSKEYKAMQKNFEKILLNENLTEETRYALVSRIASNMLTVKDYDSLVLFLTEWVEDHPQDHYNSYWLLMTAYVYLLNDAKPMAEYYFERIINNYNDLLVQGKSLHYICYDYLIQLSTNSANRIYYFNQMINRFPDQVSETEMLYRLAMEYENEGQWDQAIKTLTKFLDRSDAQTIAIKGYPNAYSEAKQLIDFNNSTKSWTFTSLSSLVTSVKRAMENYNWAALDRYRSKVNFFTISWRQDSEESALPEDFSMGNFMNGTTIRYSETLDKASSATEAYLKTTGWSYTMSTWYLYFRKVNFPADPEFHGSWEWAGIYFGEKM